MINVKQREKKKQYKYGVIACFLISITLFSGLIPFIDDNFAKSGKNDDSEPVWYDPSLADFLYEESVDQTSYNFNAYNESYIICKIQNTAFTTFTFNNSVYNVSYGLNAFPIDFGTLNQSYSIDISQSDANNDVFDWICVQPLIIKEDTINTEMATPTPIPFEAGGSISILVQPNFSYNCLYLEVDDIIVNQMYTNYTEYPQISSDELIVYRYEGVYIQYDLQFKPSQHTIKFKGNGSIEYKIVSAFDWDEDLISDVEEIQKEMNPTEAIVWGYYESGSSYTEIYAYENETIIYKFYIPESYKGYKYLSIVLYYGLITEISIDGNIFSEKDYSVLYDDYAISIPLKTLTSGFHAIELKSDSYSVVDIRFTLDGRKIYLMNMPNLRDTDMDGTKDIVEKKQSGLNFLIPDTDDDGLRDSFDGSPNASLVLDNENLYQFIVPHNDTKNTLIDLSIKRPEGNSDYYTDSHMLWNDLEVSIHPIIRLFGNSSFTMSELVETWGKYNQTYSITGTYPSYGDGVINLDDEQAELVIIPAKPSENTFEFSLIYEIGHSAKIDSVIDMRFDIVWAVSSYYGEESEIIHFYNFDDDIILQSFERKEIQNVSYILASPDSMIENEIIWNLAQNSNLGSFSYFNVSDDIVGSGNVDFMDLIDHLEDDRSNNPISTDVLGNNDENEVLYLSMLQSNYDILYNIHIATGLKSSALDLAYIGEYETYFSFYSIDDVIEEDISIIQFEETVGELEILYIKSWDNYNLEENEMEQRLSIENFPIKMELIDHYQSGKILEITHVSGLDIPKNKLPYSIDDVDYDKLIFVNITLIERNEFSSGIPSLSFDNENDEFKYSYDTRLFEVPLSNLIFHSYSPAEALKIRTYFDILYDIYGGDLRKYWDRVFDARCVFNDFETNCIDRYWRALEQTGYYTEYGVVDSTVIKIGNVEFHKLTSMEEAFNDALDPKIAPFLRIKRLRELKYVLEDSYERALKKKSASYFTNHIEYNNRLAVGENVDDLLAKMTSDDEHFKILETGRNCLYKFVNEQLKKFEGMTSTKTISARIRWFLSSGSLTRLAIGVGCLTLGIMSFVASLVELIEIPSIEDVGLGIFIVRLASGLTKLFYGITLIHLSITFLRQSVAVYKGFIARSISETLSSYGRILNFFGVIIPLIDCILAIDDILSGTMTDWKRAKIVIEIIRCTSIVIPNMITLICGTSSKAGVWGAIISLAVMVGWLVWDLIYNMLNPRITPVGSVKISDDPNETYLEFPEADIKRHGSLEVGDQVKFHLNVTRDGTVDVWMRACFSAGESDWSADQGKWTGDGYDTQGESAEYTFTITLPNTQGVTELKTDIEMDMYTNGRENVYNEITTWYADIPILDSSIADFYDDLTDFEKPNSYDELIREYESLKDTYKYKDTSDILSILKNRTEWDFLNDTVGQIPSGWNKNEVDKGVFKLLPNGDDLDAYCWSVSTGEDYYTEINETEKYWGSQFPLKLIGWQYGDSYYYDGYEVRFDFPTINDFTTCTKVEVHILARGEADVGEFTKCRISYNGDDWTSQQSKRIDGDWDWYKYSFYVSWNNIDDFQVELECPDTPEIGDWADIDVLYAEFTCTNSEANAPSIINSQSGHNNVMSIEIYGQDASCNFYRDLSPSRYAGSIDFWMYKDNHSLIDIDMFCQIDESGNIYQSDGETLIWALGVHSFMWTHFKIEYDSTDFDLYLNGIKIGNDITHSKTDFSKIEFIAFNDFDCENEIKSTITRVYLDSIDASWKNNYFDWRSYSWDYSLDNISYYDNLYDDLIISTNIDSDLSENIIEMDTDTDEAIFCFDLDLSGTDYPSVNITLDVLNDFTLNTTLLTQTLNSEINFKVTANDAFQYAGIYYIDMNITISNEEIYFERIPFRIPIVEDFTIEQNGIIFEDNDIDGEEYTATYDFLDDVVDEVPDGWSDLSTGVGYAKVISNLDEHDKTVEFYHGAGAGDDAGIEDTFSSSQTSGTVEFWWRTNDATITSNVILNGGATQSILFRCTADVFQIHNGASYQTLSTTPLDDTWYHIRIDFECGAGGYKGLSADTSTIYINGVNEGTYGFGNVVDSQTKIWFWTGATAVYYNWVDAVGYSWDDNYKIGDNLYKTEISTGDYGSTTQLKKGDILNIEYRTNSYDEITLDLLNNDVIQETYSMVRRGTVYNGIQYSQIIIDDTITFDEIEFLINDCSWLDILNISVLDATATVSQYFNPVNFTNMGNIPVFIPFTFSGIPFENINQSEYSNEFFGESQIVIIEPNSTRTMNFNITHPNESIDNLYWRGLSYSNIGNGEIYNYRYYDSLEFDGIYIVSPQNKINVFGDAISSGKYEFNLDIIPEETLVWSAYSFNGNNNITFSGTANITLPEQDGEYSIQVFGNNSGGTMFQSEVRNFTISYPIKIISPEKKTPYNPDGVLFYINSGFNEYEYSLDGFVKKPFENNSTINCCIGDHSIIIYGNDTYGDEYRSEKYSFTVLPVYIAPSQPDNFTFNMGSLQTPYGDLETIDGNYSNFISTDEVKEFINSVSYLQGSFGGGSLANTHTDNSNYYQMNSEYKFAVHGVATTFNFDPSLSGRDFYISAHIVTSDSIVGCISINGQGWKSGTNINFDDELVTGVNIIRFSTNSESTSHNSKIYYFKLVENPTGVPDLDFQVDMQVDNPNCYSVTSLQYSHRTNISATVDLDIWNWGTSSWDEIESVDNSVNFDDDLFTLGNNSAYLNSTFGVRIRFQALNQLNEFQLEIDRLRLEYAFTIGSIIHGIPSQPDNFTFNDGSLQTPYGDLEIVDGNYSVWLSTLGIFVPDEFIDSITYNWGTDGGGTLENTHTDDANYKRTNSKYLGNPFYLYWIVITLNFDPALAGRDFYISAHIDTSGGNTGRLKINGVDWKTGSSIDFDNELKTGVTSITFETDKVAGSHYSLIYYFKLVEDGEVEIPDLDVQVDMQVEDPNCYFVTTLQYSYRTNVSVTVDLDIWNWGTSSWDEIESVDNFANFDDDFFTLSLGSDYVNSTFGVRIRFQAIDQPNEFQLEIDRLRLDYTNYT